MSNGEYIHVLYIDDDPDSVEMIRVLLGFSRIELDSASTADEALRLSGAGRFDLYILDSGLPDGNGLDLCRSLHAADPGTPVLFYSGRAHPSEIQKAIAAGAQGYITKPHSDKLAETIIRLVDGTRETDSARRSLPVFAAA